MKIDFEIETPQGLFRDALHLPDDHGFSETEIQAMKQQRVDNWIAVVTAPPAEEPTPVQEPAQDFIEVDGIRYAKVIE